MPIYEYACSSCGHEMEARQQFSDDPLTLCPECNKENLERMVSNSSFALKGSGWYADGYGPTGKSTGDKAPKPTPTETKSETKKADAPKKAAAKDT